MAKALVEDDRVGSASSSIKSIRLDELNSHAMNPNRNPTRLVERAELLEDELGIHISALYVGPSLPFGKLLSINGELASVDSTSLLQSLRLVAEVYDRSWQRLHSAYRS